MIPRRSAPSRPAPWLLLGLVAFALGLGTARAWLPEWDLGTLPPASAFVSRSRALAARAELELERSAPRVRLVARDEPLALPSRPFAGREPGSDPRLGARVQVEVERRGSFPGEEVPRSFSLLFSPQTLALSSVSAEPNVLRFAQATLESPAMAPGRSVSFARLLLLPGETLSKPRQTFLSGSPVSLYEIAGSDPPAHAIAGDLPGSQIVAYRLLGSTARSLVAPPGIPLRRLIIHGTAPLLLVLATFFLFVALLSRRRIDLINGALLAALVLAIDLPLSLAVSSDVTTAVLNTVRSAVAALWILVLWSAGESFVRATDAEFTTSLDALRVGRLGPRGGRALWIGFGLGAALAGLRLALMAVAVPLHGAWPEALSLQLPIFGAAVNPVGTGIGAAAVVTVALAFAQRLLPRRWAPWAAALAVAILRPAPQLHPYSLSLAASLAGAGLLVFVGRRFGLTALLTTAIVSLLLPAAVFSALHLDWLPATFGVTTGLSAALLALGAIGLGRDPKVEMERLVPPAFIRRLEEERRIRYEMDLLARMQTGLLPQGPPEIAGWEVAARSLLATEAGGDLYDFLQDDGGHLWIAAGDVAGHGYSCAIVHAMTTAALASLVEPGKSPAQVLQQIDRVIRRGGSRRNFISLALLRLDPATGEALLANAGHPFPLLITGGGVEEIVLPGLPLGHGPSRTYRDLHLFLAPGSSLAFCSDGLHEANDWSGEPYGFERPREVLRAALRRPAAAIVEALLADWKRYLRSEEPPDDTTVIVLKRRG